MKVLVGRGLRGEGREEGRGRKREEGGRGEGGRREGGEREEGGREERGRKEGGERRVKWKGSAWMRI